MAYESERGNPVTPQCSTLSLLFDGYYLKLAMNSVVSAGWHARSGHASNDLFSYALDVQQKTGGPIPEGSYWIKPDEYWSAAGILSDRRGWGNFRITIHPYPTTETFGRGGFFIHGGAVFGSSGCIDLCWAMDSFIVKLKDLIPTMRAPNGFAFSSPCYIPLTVKYGTSVVGYPEGLPGTPEHPASV